jgi:DNA (cytosine-5)-methyltransferase 1
MLDVTHKYPAPASDAQRTNAPATGPRFLEFFCGGGLARVGLGPFWNCVLANDISDEKIAAYVRNFGSTGVVAGDIAGLHAARMPGADLAWASFPCQDLSLAGGRRGMAPGTRSGAFWSFHSLLSHLRDKRRAPRVVVLENVCGALSSNGGRDFIAIVAALATAGYRSGALVADAALFVPQSRPRLFIVAVDRDLPVPVALTAGDPSIWRTHALDSALDLLSRIAPDLGAAHISWNPPAPPARNTALADLLEQDAPWAPAEKAKAIIAAMSPVGLAKLAEARKKPGGVTGAVAVRTRPGRDGVHRPRAEPRFDGLIGCLRTPRGGSSHQLLIQADARAVRVRKPTPRECARLMGAPDSYVLPDTATHAYRLVGDAVSPPVVAHIARHILEPLLRRAR